MTRDLQFLSYERSESRALEIDETVRCKKKRLYERSPLGSKEGKHADSGDILLENREYQEVG